MKKDKSKKGFTLVEIIVAITIMGIVLVIAMPKIVNMIQGHKEDKYEAYMRSIERGAKLYIDSNGDVMFKNKATGCGLVKYSDLKNKNLVKDIQEKDVTCDKDEDTYVTVTKMGEKEFMYGTSVVCMKKGVTDPVYKYLGAKKIEDCKLIEDNTPPTITLSRYKFGNNEWRNKNNAEKIDVTIKDEGIGFAKNYVVRYKWRKKGTSEVISKKLTFSNKKGALELKTTLNKSDYPTGTGEYEIYFEDIEDYAKNKLPGAAKGNFRFDNTNPTCTITTTAKQTSGWYTKDIPLTLNRNDVGSGVDTYGIVGNTKEPSATYNKYGSWTIKTENKGTINGYGFVKDKAGNVGKCVKKDNKLDKTAPTGMKVYLKKRSSSKTLTCSDKYGSLKDYNSKWYDGYVYTRADKAKDAMGNGTYYYLTTKGQDKDVTNKKQSCRNVDKQGTVTVSYKVCDKLNNCTGYKNSTIKLDRTDPKCTATKSDTKTTKGVTVKFTCTDKHSGIDSCPKKVTKLKKTTSYTAKDNVGRKDTVKVTVTSYKDTDGCSKYKYCQNSACGSTTYYTCICYQTKVGTSKEKKYNGPVRCTKKKNGQYGGLPSKFCGTANQYYMYAIRSTKHTSTNSCRTSKCGCETYKYVTKYK